MTALGFWWVRDFGLLRAAIGTVAANFVTMAVRVGASLKFPVRVSGSA
jgi:hypothetical protein